LLLFSGSFSLKCLLLGVSHRLQMHRNAPVRKARRPCLAPAPPGREDPAPSPRKAVLGWTGRRGVAGNRDEQRRATAPRPTCAAPLTARPAPTPAGAPAAGARGGEARGPGSSPRSCHAPVPGLRPPLAPRGRRGRKRRAAGPTARSGTEADRRVPRRAQGPDPPRALPAARSQPCPPAHLLRRVQHSLRRWHRASPDPASAQAPPRDTPTNTAPPPCPPSDAGALGPAHG
jgi:hypothetical protein